MSTCSWLFLDQLGRKLDKRRYALKGGCNLRFYLRSIRYSDDMDLDVETTPADVLRDRVEQILAGKSLAQILQARGLTITMYSAPKQTETTQRWKLALAVVSHLRRQPCLTSIGNPIWNSGTHEETIANNS